MADTYGPFSRYTEVDIPKVGLFGLHRGETLTVDRDGNLTRGFAAYDSPPIVRAEPAETVSEPGWFRSDVPDGAIPVVMDWVGDDPERAALALEAEQEADEPRTTLISRLEALLEPDEVGEDE